MWLSFWEEIQAVSLMTLFKMFKYMHRDSRLWGHAFSHLIFIKFLLCDSHSDGFREYHGEQSILDFLGPHQSISEPTKKLRVAVLRKWAAGHDSATIARMVRDIPRRQVWAETWYIKSSQSWEGLGREAASMKHQGRTMLRVLADRKEGQASTEWSKGMMVQAQRQRLAKASSCRAW